MKPFLVSPAILGAAGLCLAGLGAPADLRAQSSVTVSSTVLQSNFNGATGAGESAPIAASAFNFTGQPTLADIQSVSITLTVIDGDTGLGPNGIVDTPYPPPGDGTQFGDDDFDVNSLSLRLDGIDAGRNLLLNGFNNYDSGAPLAPSDFVRLTLTGAPANVGALLAALADGQLTATIFDATGISMSNGFQVPNTLIDRMTPVSATLSLTGTAAVPEPGTSALLLAGIGAAAIGRLGWRRWRVVDQPSCRSASVKRSHSALRFTEAPLQDPFSDGSAGA